MPLEEIKKSIEAEAKSQAEKYARSSKEESQKLANDAERAAKEILAESRKNVLGEAERIMKEGKESFETEAHGILAQAAEESINREAKRVNMEMQKEIRKKHMEKLLENAVSAFLTAASRQEMVVSGNMKYENHMKRKGYAFQKSSIDGFAISTKDGRVKLDATIGKLLENNSEMIKSAISRKMFPNAAKPNASKHAGGSGERKSAERKKQKYKKAGDGSAKKRMHQKGSRRR